MATNTTVFPVEGQAVIWFEDGTSMAVDAQQGHSFQIPSGSFVTISDAPEDASEHPPPGYAFAHAMVEFWQAMVDKLQQPEVNPL